MTVEEALAPRCLVAISPRPSRYPLARSVAAAAEHAGYVVERLYVPDLLHGGQAELAETLARSDCVVAELRGRYEPELERLVALAQDMGRPVIRLMKEDSTLSAAASAHGRHLLPYSPSPGGFSQLRRRLSEALLEHRQSPLRTRPASRTPLVVPSDVEWDRLDPREIENLCLELLAQMGYERTEWHRGPLEVDLVAELPKRDPDGFEYRELWLVAMGLRTPLEMVAEKLAVSLHVDRDGFLGRLLRDAPKGQRRLARGAGEAAITVLLIALRREADTDRLRAFSAGFESGRPPYSNIRFRVWDRAHVTSLVQQFPQLVYKYFSDEARAQSKYRKTPEELYTENVALSERLAATVAELREEKGRRVRAEVDAVWKDISFSAAHRMGNPIFAIETDLGPLARRVTEGRVDEAIEVLGSVRASVEKAKGIVDQFKSLTRAQQIAPGALELRPLVDDACRPLATQGVDCEIICPPDITVMADPERLAECLDELAANATHWFDKDERKVRIEVTRAEPRVLADGLAADSEYALIRFQDNGRGVPVGQKERIFDAFYTTHDHGTGLGLALVRRVIEGHGGVIREVGVPGQGAEFDIYLPLAKAGAT